MNKNSLIKSLVFAALALTSVNAGAAVATVTTTSANTNSVINSNQVFISQVTVENLVAQPLQVALFDAPTNVTTFTVGAFTNYTTFTTNLVTVFTNFTGVVQTNTNSGIFTEARSIPARTNNYRMLAALAVGASSTVTYEPVNGLITSYGVLSTNNTNCTITITYSTIR